MIVDESTASRCSVLGTAIGTALRIDVVERYTLNDLLSGMPSYSLDVDRFEPPPKPLEEP